MSSEKGLVWSKQVWYGAKVSFKFICCCLYRKAHLHHNPMLLIKRTLSSSERGWEKLEVNTDFFFHFRTFFTWSSKEDKVKDPVDWTIHSRIIWLNSHETWAGRCGPVLTINMTPPVFSSYILKQAHSLFQWTHHGGIYRVILPPRWVLWLNRSGMARVLHRSCRQAW